MIVLHLFWEFFKTGLFAVGGGLATLPFLYRMSEMTGWFTMQDIADLIAISESTPGPIGVNMATYVGYQTLGLFGGVISTLGLVFPSILIILLVSRVLEKFKESSLVKKVFYGLRPASTALILAAGIGVAKIALLHLDTFRETKAWEDVFNWPCMIMAVLFFAAIRILPGKGICGKKWKVHPIAYIALAAAVGVIFKL